MQCDVKNQGNYLMKFRLALLCFGLLMAATSLHAAEKSEAGLLPIDQPYSADHPPGPSFSPAERARQRAEGKRVLAELRAAFQAGRDAFTIPPGDYRFDAEYHDTEHAFSLTDLRRDADQPFRIIAQGVTAWFDLSDRPIPSLHRFVKITRCRHLSLEGLVIDSDPRGCMDARIVAIDIPGNRLRVQLLAGARRIAQLPGSEGRMLVFKANGHNIPALYRIDDGWGPGNFHLERLEWTSEDQCWLQLKTTTLLGTLTDARWQRAYGTAGLLQVGDVVSVLYSTANAFSVDDSERITIRACRVHAAKAGLSESGGYGAHRWIDCWFLARPGTNQVLGGDGTMNNALRHGSLFEGRIVQRTTDDAFNNHGYWKNVVEAGDQHLVFANPPPAGLTAGDRAELFDPQRKRSLGRLTVSQVDGKRVAFREPVGERFAGASAMFLDFQNAGWEVRRSLFIDCYQRILLQSGPGRFSNNRIERVGSGLVVEAGVIGHIEGGSPDGVVIRDNLFVDSGICPANRTISISGSGRPLTGLVFSGNVVCGSGREAVYAQLVDGMRCEGNLFLDQQRGRDLLPKHHILGSPTLSLVHAPNVELVKNVVMHHQLKADGKHIAVHLDGSSKANERDTLLLLDDGRLADRIRSLTIRHEHDANAIIAKLRQEFPYVIPDPVAEFPKPLDCP